MQIEHLEDPKRVRELNIEKTFEKLGLDDATSFCDIGAGAGVYAIPAAKLPAKFVYALDVNNEFVAYIRQKAADEKIKNIEAIKIDGLHYPFASGSIDLAFMSCVLHEIDEDSRPAVLREIKRVIDPDKGRFAVVEFGPTIGTFGPPASERIKEEELIALAESCGLSYQSRFDVSASLYCLVFG